MRTCPRCHATYRADMERCGVDGEPLTEREDDPLVGRAVDRYRIEARLGAGAMGCVYRARHEFLGSVHAIKVLYGELACVRTIAERFRREAQALSRVRHPNIVEISDFGTTEAGLAFLVMSYVEGRTLSAALEEDRPITLARAAAITRQISEGLAAAHASGFVHRDLKPANVMLARQDGAEIAKILDFGIAKEIDAGGADRLTQTGIILGTPSYMAPEQAQGGDVGPGADLYALGVILYEMLAGAPPFTGSTQAVLMKHILERPPPLPRAGGLEVLAEELLAKSPFERPPSARAVADRLRDFDGAEPASPGRSTSGAPRRRWLAAAGAAAFLGALLIMLALPAGRPRQPPLDSEPLSGVVGGGYTADAGSGEAMAIAEPARAHAAVAAGAPPADPPRAAIPRDGRPDAGPPPNFDAPAEPGTSLATREAQRDATLPPNLAAPAEPVKSLPARKARPDAGPPPRSPEALSAELDRRLERAGLERDDLDAVPAARDALRSLRGRPSAEQEIAALEALIAASSSATLCGGPLRRRLDRANAALAEAQQQLPAAEVSGLEETYFELSVAAGPKMADEECRALARRLAAFHGDLDARVRAARARGR